MRIDRTLLRAAALPLFCAALFFAPESAHSEEPVVLGYYPAWERDTLPADKVDFTILTNIIHAFAWPDSNGVLKFWEGFHYPGLVEAAHKANRKISVALGGWGQCTGFPPSTANAASRAKFIGNILEFCEKNSYDGVDIDWEFPANPVEKANLTALVSELRAAADKRGKPFLITMAVSSGTWSGDHNDYAALKQYVDWFNDMTYDFYGSWTDRAGHNAPLYATQESVDASIRFLTVKMGVPPQKILLGLPFYGRTFIADRLYGPGKGGDAINYRNISGKIAEGGWTDRYDDFSKVPYLVNEKAGSMIFYDNPASIALKCMYARDKKLRGVMIWALGADYRDGKQPLLDAIGTVMKAR